MCSGRARRRRGGRAVRAVRPPVQQRLQPAAARAADPRGAAGRLRHLRPLLQDAAVSPAAHARAAPRAAAAAAAALGAAAAAAHRRLARSLQVVHARAGGRGFGWCRARRFTLSCDAREASP